jgi:para-nitrobenzyl esterase
MTTQNGAIDRRTWLAGAGALAGLVAAPAIAGAAAPIARTTAGQVQGTYDSGIATFKAIRYGADTRPRRFQPPRKPKPWSGVYDARTYGAACPQSRGGEPMSEDCLFLNVWTPALRDGGKRTVMVYIHGGAYSNGSGSAAIYDGVNLSRRGNVVVVTLNHRLNAFGYLSLGMMDAAFADSGNAGQLDLVLALEWVRENIAEFGGDPDTVMVFGQSGGGAKIATMMAMPAAKGLFHRAATMSGQQVTGANLSRGHRDFAEEPGRSGGCADAKAGRRAEGDRPDHRRGRHLFRTGARFPFPVAPPLLSRCARAIRRHSDDDRQYA